MKDPNRGAGSVTADEVLITSRTSVIAHIWSRRFIALTSYSLDSRDNPRTSLRIQYCILDPNGYNVSRRISVIDSTLKGEKIHVQIRKMQNLGCLSARLRSNFHSRSRQSRVEVFTSVIFRDRRNRAVGCRKLRSANHDSVETGKIRELNHLGHDGTVCFSGVVGTDGRFRLVEADAKLTDQAGSKIG